VIASRKARCPSTNTILTSESRGLAIMGIHSYLLGDESRRVHYAKRSRPGESADLPEPMLFRAGRKCIDKIRPNTWRITIPRVYEKRAIGERIAF
jgi:hypothetical protein